MLALTHDAASAAILAACDAGTLTQGQWHGRGSDGREIACLLGAMDPRVKQPSDCNGELMPMWLAELTPTLFDGIPAGEIYPIARRYGGLVARWHVLQSAQWDALLARFLIRTIDDAVEAARPVASDKPYWPAVEAACKQSREAVEWGDAEKKKAAAADADAAADAARAAAYTAADAARAAADAAAAYAAAYTARAERYLALFTFLLDQIERELGT